jgi:hypothetical protein
MTTLLSDHMAWVLFPWVLGTRLGTDGIYRARSGTALIWAGTWTGLGYLLGTAMAAHSA